MYEMQTNNLVLWQSTDDISLRKGRRTIVSPYLILPFRCLGSVKTEKEAEKARDYFLFVFI